MHDVAELLRVPAATLRYRRHQRTGPDSVKTGRHVRYRPCASRAKSPPAPRRVPDPADPLAPLLERIWQLRANVTAYDAAFVTLAEQLSAPGITCDAKLAPAGGTRCTFDLIS